MTQEEKEILLKDLCSRLPYNNHADYNYNIRTHLHIKTDTIDKKDLLIGIIFVGGITPGISINKWDKIVCTLSGYRYTLEEVRPYLRPMSSMTKDEVLEYISLKERIIAADGITYFFETHRSIDWLNAHHFDYRGLIEKGLALEALEGMYD